MRKTSKIISMILIAIMFMGLMTSASFAAVSLPTTFGWSATNAGYITIDVPAFDGEEIEYLLDLYKDGNRVTEDFEEGGMFESEIFVNKINELGNGTYKFKIGLERDFDTDEIINGTSFSTEYVATSFSHSVAVEPVGTNSNTGSEPSPAIPANPENTGSVTDTPEEPKQEETELQSVIKGQVTYANKYYTNYGETKPLAGASVTLYKRQGANEIWQHISARTDSDGRFELAFKPGDYDLRIIYGGSEMTVKVNMGAETTDLGIIKFEPYNYTTTGTALIIPNSVDVIEIREDNFNDYFEDVKIIGEQEKNAAYLSNNSGYDTENVIGSILGYSFGSFNEENDLWLISSLNMPGFKYRQSNAIYNEKSNVIYKLSERNSSTGYVISDFKDNGLLTVTKFETTSFGNPTIYKITEMTARFKKVPYITVSYNGEFINFDQKPVAENGRTLVPLRAIFNKLGATVEWDQATQTVTATKGDVVITLTLDNTTATKNGEPIILDVPAKAISGRMLVPVRFIADCFEVKTGWDGDAQRVILTG